MSNAFEDVFGAAASVAKGMSVTFKEMLSPTVTENYPDEPPKLEERYRGVHVLQRDENGMEKCVACFLCAAACPSNCIYIEAAENTAQVRISGGERYAKVYNIDYNRCIFCGYCVEACPTDAITHGHGFEVASYNTSTLVKRKRICSRPCPPARSPGMAGNTPRPRTEESRRAAHLGDAYVSSHPGTDRHDFPGGSGRQERARNRPLLPRLSRHAAAPPGAQALSLRRSRCCRA